MAFYTALLKCYGSLDKIPCDIARLALAQLAMRGDVSGTLWELAQADAPNLFACFGPNPVLLAGLGGLAAGNGGAAGAGGGSGGGGGVSGATPPPPGETPEPTKIPDSFGAPYAVKQIESLGGESISGFVCSTSHRSRSRPTHRRSRGPSGSFRKRQRQESEYAYSIPSAGESHQAKGTYTISPPEHDGTLHVSLQVSDHVVFKGFDGNIPVRYKFDLVPAAEPGCP